jgi:enoyl-[acyl-carrier-protein] reductase (NADH)
MERPAQSIDPLPEVWHPDRAVSRSSTNLSGQPSHARRLADIAEVGRVIAFLVGGGVSGMTGDIIYVDAGLHVVA